MAFDIYEFLNKNKFELGTVEKEVGDTVFKGGHNDLRKTNHEVNIKDGKLDLNTHKKVMTEGKSQLNEAALNSGPIAEMFARFLIGDREEAIKQLRGQMKKSFGTMEKGGTREWNDQFRDLKNKLEKAINQAL